jgi:alkylated DNA repair dioxygenase AlkB
MNLKKEQLPQEDNLTRLLNGEYIFVKDFIPQKEADAILDYLTNQIKWKQGNIRMFGKNIAIPRLTAWYGDQGMNYNYSGINNDPTPWTSELQGLKAKVELAANTSFNSVLLNQYRDGNDSVSWHADNEKELGENPIIGSVNLGATRVFKLKHNITKEVKKINLTHGSLLVMGGKMQHYWKHAVPKTAKKIDARINLTFRLIK